jgi:membrane protein
MLSFKEFVRLLTAEGRAPLREQYYAWLQRYRVTRFLHAFATLFKQYEIMKESAALTFTTMMGFIPFTVFILMLIPSLPFLQAQAAIRKVIIANFVPKSAVAVSGYIDQLLVMQHSFNWMNYVVLTISSYALFRIISKTFDRILHVRQSAPKSPLYNLVQFFGTIVLGSVMILILFSVTSVPLMTSLFDLGMLQTALNWVLPFVFTFVFLLLLFYAVPSSKTRTNSLLIGTLVCSAIWFFVKSGYGWYIDYFTNYRGFYGVLASIPVFIFWIYLNWAIILGGVVVIAILEERPQEQSPDTVVTVQITVEKKYSNQTLRLSRRDARDILRQILNEDTNRDNE